MCLYIVLGREKASPALVPAGDFGTACRAVLLTAVACLQVAAASSASGGLSAVPLNLKGERSDRNAGLQAWGHLLGSAVLFNKVPDSLWTHVASLSYLSLHFYSAVVMAITNQECSGLVLWSGSSVND